MTVYLIPEQPPLHQAKIPHKAQDQDQELDSKGAKEKEDSSEAALDCGPALDLEIRIHGSKAQGLGQGPPGDDQAHGNGDPPHRAGDLKQGVGGNNQKEDDQGKGDAIKEVLAAQVALQGQGRRTDHGKGHAFGPNRGIDKTGCQGGGYKASCPDIGKGDDVGDLVCREKGALQGQGLKIIEVDHDQGPHQKELGPFRGVAEKEFGLLMEDAEQGRRVIGLAGKAQIPAKGFLGFRKAAGEKPFHQPLPAPVTDDGSEDEQAYCAPVDQSILEIVIEELVGPGRR